MRSFIVSKLNLTYLTKLVIAFTVILSSAGLVLASATSNFTQTITGGSLAVDIVDAGYATVGSPSVAMTNAAFSFACQTVTGTFGTAGQQIYITNPDAADNGWTVSLASGAATNVWDGAASDFDFNDPTGSGCTDGGDADSVGGQMTVDASGGTLAAGQCDSCTTNNISKGASGSFSQGVTDSITILTGAANSDDIGDWSLTDVDISQKIPAEQGVANDYDINMTVSIVAS